MNALEYLIEWHAELIEMHLPTKYERDLIEILWDRICELQEKERVNL